jgi:hypothetical protein
MAFENAGSKAIQKLNYNYYPLLSSGKAMEFFGVQSIGFGACG